MGAALLEPGVARLEEACEQANPERRTNVEGTVYLLHFDQWVGEPGHKGARHYMGWAEEGRLFRRLAEHEAGNGKATPVVRALLARGGSFALARTWKGDRFLERRLKNRGGAARLCPVCKAAGSETN